jgi:hypothetical protein
MIDSISVLDFSPTIYSDLNLALDFAFLVIENQIKPSQRYNFFNDIDEKFFLEGKITVEEYLITNVESHNPEDYLKDPTE